MKNPDPYRGKILDYKAVALSFIEQTVDDVPITFIHIADRKHDYFLIMLKEKGNIKEHDDIRFWGTPIGTESFEAKDGKQRTAQVFFGSHIEKII